MNIIQIKNLSKKLQDKQILKDITIDIKKGEIITLVGPSGSGKSTLLRCINRLIESDNGTIKYNNNNIKEITPAELRRNIVLVQQESVMFPGTIYENLSYSLKLQNKNNEELIKKSIIDAGLSEDFLEKNSEKISGGEKKRVALARALVLQPEILLLDEPTSGVDPKKIQTVEKNIINFSKNRKLTVIWVTHNIDQAKRVSHRISNLKDGKIISVQNTKDFKWEVAY